jgi:hypothetical protein
LLSDWLFARTDATHRIALERLAVLVGQWLAERGMDVDAAKALVASDYAGKVNLPRKGARVKSDAKPEAVVEKSVPQRQARHMAA